MMSLDRFPSHVFLSYSSSDEKAARRVLESFARDGIVVWRDRESLAPGTPNWERAIRGAMSRAYSVALLASPSSRDSAFVQTELAIAKAEGVPVFPLWIAGETWAESVSFSAMQAQHIDVRGPKYDTGLSGAADSLKRALEARLPRHTQLADAFGAWYDLSLPSLWDGLGHYLAIPLDERPSSRTPEGLRRREKAILVNPSAYPTAQALLDELYVHYLHDRYPPLSYGDEWLLLEEYAPRDPADQRVFAINPKRVLASWRWFVAPVPTAIADVDPGWLAKPPSAYGLVAHSIWRIRAPSENDRYGNTPRQSAFGLAVNDRNILDYVMTGPGKQPHPTVRAGFLEVVELRDCDPDTYRYRLVVLDEWSRKPFAGKVLREGRRPFDSSYFEADGDG